MRALMSSQRLQKVLAQAGVASRRAAEKLIEEGRVRVNGRIVRELGARAAPRDRVEVDGKRLVAEHPVYYLMHKPRGVVTTLSDPEGRRTVKDLLRHVEQRVFPVGRLDFQTSGALLLTNDGGLAQALLHPRRAVPKTYSAKLEGTFDAQHLEALRTGVVLDDGEKTAPADVHIVRAEGKYTSIEISISEGKNRQIHRMAEAIGCSVSRLTRISFAGLTLEGLRAGQLRTLSALELAELKQKYVNTNSRHRPFGAAARARAQEQEERELDGSYDPYELDEGSGFEVDFEPERPRRPARSGPVKARASAVAGTGTRGRASNAGPAQRVTRSGPTKGRGVQDGSSLRSGPTKGRRSQDDAPRRGPAKGGRSQDDALRGGPTKGRRSQDDALRSGPAKGRSSQDGTVNGRAVKATRRRTQTQSGQASRERRTRTTN